MFEFELYLKACDIHSEEFATRWANSWKEHMDNAERQQEGYEYTNCRSVVLDTGRQFERHLSTIMHHRSHQQEF